MGTAAKSIVASPADLIEIARRAIRTGQHTPLGRMQKIAIGPSADYRAPDDPVINRFGRLIDLRDRMLPLAETTLGGTQMLVVPGRLMDYEGKPKLPDLPMPDWTPPTPSRGQVEAHPEKKGDRTVMVFDEPAIERPRPMIPQRLTDRCEQFQGKPAFLERTRFLIFQPVLRITYQPEVNGELVGTSHFLDFEPDFDGRSPVLLAEADTGECFFLYGSYHKFRPVGE